MKTIKRIAVLAALTFLSVAASAQIKIGADLNVGMPTSSDFGDYAGTGFGGGINAKYMFNENMGAGLGFSYLSFPGKDFADGINFTIMPITANFTYYFMTETLKPYAGIDLGLYTASSDADGAESESDFGFAPVVGMEYAFTDALALNVNLKYNYIMSKDDDKGTEDTSFLGINVGIVYSLGK